MDYELFDIGKFNVIEDDEFYYVFRALNKADHNDVINYFLEHKEDVPRIRTDRERYEQVHGEAKYRSDSEISLEEVYDHIKMHYLKETNCISLSTNANVSLDYGSSYFDEYAVVKVPKNQETANILHAGNYMLFEMFIRIEEVLSDKNLDSAVFEYIRLIETSRSNEEVIRLISSLVSDIGYERNIVSRFQIRQYFDSRQQLEYNKLVAKATVLEVLGLLPSILEDNKDNQSLLSTLGSAFSSGEIIHYKDIPRSSFRFVTKRMMNLFAITQQLKDKFSDNQYVLDLERKLIELCNAGYDVKVINGDIVLTNGTEIIRTGLREESTDIFEKTEMDESLLSVLEIYNMTGGTIPYEKAKKAVEFCYYLAQSRKETFDYANIVSAITGNNNLLEEIMNRTFVVNSKIIDRGNNNGFKLCESVNIGIENEGGKYYTFREQSNLINLVLSLDLDKIEMLLDNRGVVFRNTIIGGIPASGSLSKNEYFAKSIIESLDFSKIYDETVSKDRVDEYKEKLIKGMSASEVSRLYEAFYNLELSHEEISYYVFNLFIEARYKGYTFDELCNLEDINDFIKTNFTVFNRDINELTLNNYLGIFKDSNYVPNSHIYLRDFQQRIKNETDRIFNEGRRFAGVVLPTGGGKSFVAMAEMMERQDSKIIYIAPRIGILRNFKKNIVQYVGGVDPEGLSDRELDIIAKDCFPHLELICYQSLDTKDEEKLANFNADFIILDEIHHIGGESWNPVVKELLDTNPNAKVLGISATPQRDEYIELSGENYFDMYGGDMMMAMAAYLDDYTFTELMQKKYLACDINIIDAIQEGYVICPNIISFDYSLDQTDEFRKTLALARKIKNPLVKKRAEDEVQRMLKVVNHAKLNGVDSIINEYLRVKDGKYILFLPRKAGYNGSTDQYIEESIEEFKTMIYEIDSDPHIDYIHSGRSKEVNQRVMQDFELDNSEHMKILVAIDMLNEGIHLPNINGSFNFRKIDKKHLILALQHLGRVVFAIDPNKEYTESDIPVVFDKFNNYSNIDMDRLVNKKTVTSDLEKLKDAIFWIEKYGRIPRLDSSDFQEKKKAVTLKRIQEKYFKFINANLDDYSLNDYDKANTMEIVELCSRYNIWDIDLGVITKEQLRKIDRINLFNVSAVKESFLEVCNNVQSLAGVQQLKTGDRLELIIKVLDILAENNIILTPDTIYESFVMEDLLCNIDSNVVDDIKFEINRLGLGLKYPFGQEYYFARNCFFANKSIFSTYDYTLEEITNLRKYGILCNGPDFLFINDKGFVFNGPTGLMRKNIWTGTYFSKDNCNIEGYDPYDFDVNTGINRRTLDIYDAYGFDFEHINRDTGTRYDIHGFDINHNHRDTNNACDKRGFDINGNWHRYDKENEVYKPSYSKYDSDGYDIDRYDRNGFDENGIHRVTGLQYDEMFFDKEGIFWFLNADGERVKSDKKYNTEMYDRKGFLYEKKKETEEAVRVGQVYNEYGFYENGLHYKTKTILDPEGYDMRGMWHRKLPDGSYVNTNSIFNDHGWTRDKLTVRHSVYGVPFDDDRNLFLDFVDDYGFDVDGRYHYPIDKIDEYGFVEQQSGTIRYSKRIMYKKMLYAEFYDIHSFNRKGICSKTGTELDEHNFDRNGYYWKQDENGEMVNTWSYFNDDGFTIDRRCIIYTPEGPVYSLYDENGFDINHLYKVKHESTKQKYDDFGFDYTGVHYITGTNLDENNFDRSGIWWRELEDGTYENTGSLFDDDGWSRFHTNIDTLRIVDSHGFNYLHLYRYPSSKKYPEGRLEEYDPYGFNYLGIHKTTGKVYNANHFDWDGYWYKKIDGVYVKTDSKFDEDGLDIDRRDANNFSKNGFYKGKRSKYNDLGFDVNGIHRLTNKPYNLDGLNMAGEMASGVDWELLRKLKEREIFNRRVFIEEVIEEIKSSYNYNEYDRILEMYDDITDEFEDYHGEIEMFVDLVKSRCIKQDEVLYTDEEIIEYLKEEARKRKAQERYLEVEDYYYSTVVMPMREAGDLSDLDFQDIRRYY